METVIRNVCPCTLGESMYPICPPYVLPPDGEAKIVLVTPMSVFVEVSYKSPVAYNWLLVNVHLVTIGTINTMFPPKYEEVGGE